MNLCVTFDLLAVGLMILQSAEAIECYTCTGPPNNNCKDPFVSEGITIVDYRNYCTKTKLSFDDVQTVTRSGGLGPAPYDGCESADGAHTCICKSNLCNAATVFAKPMWAGLFAITVVTTWICG